jgi:hypothetical protein
MEVMMNESLRKIPTRRTQAAAVCAILRDFDDLLRFAYAAIAIFLEDLRPTIIKNQEQKAHGPTLPPGRPGALIAEIATRINGLFTE